MGKVGGRINPGVRDKTKNFLDLREHLLSKEPICRLCKNAAATEVDHIEPLSKGGGNEIENLQPICRPCHIDKSLIERNKRARVRVDDEGNPIGLSNLDIQMRKRT